MSGGKVAGSQFPNIDFKKLIEFSLWSLDQVLQITILLFELKLLVERLQLNNLSVLGLQVLKSHTVLKSVVRRAHLLVESHSLDSHRAQLVDVSQLHFYDK